MLRWSQDSAFQPGPSGRTNHTEFIAWPSHRPQARLCILEELGASPSFFWAWRRARLFMGLILKGNQAQWTETKSWSEASKATFCLLLQTGYTFEAMLYWIWSQNFNQVHFSEVGGFLMQGSKLTSVHWHPARGPQGPPIRRSCLVIYNRWPTLLVSALTPDEALAVHDCHWL